VVRLKKFLQMSFSQKCLACRLKLANILADMFIKIAEYINYRMQKIKFYRNAGYQPLPWIGEESLIRDESTLKRWDMIKKTVPIDSGSVMDIGCNLGFFILSFAEMGFYGLGIDMQYGFKVIAQYVQKKSGIDNAAFSTTRITPENITALPRVDVMVFLSVWHHWICVFGHDVAREMLAILWSKTGTVMFFETGENTEIEKLQITEDPAVWAHDQLLEICENAEIKNLGCFESGLHKKDVRKRTLFAIFRKKD